MSKNGPNKTVAAFRSRVGRDQGRHPVLGRHHLVDDAARLDDARPPGQHGYAKSAFIPRGNPWRLQIPRFRHWATGWSFLSGRQGKGLHESQGLLGIRRKEPRFGVECLGLAGVTAVSPPYNFLPIDHWLAFSHVGGPASPEGSVGFPVFLDTVLTLSYSLFEVRRTDKADRHRQEPSVPEAVPR
jgi:hypothetical protein